MSEAYRVSVTLEAQAQINEVYEWIAAKDGQAALKWYLKLEAQIDRLCRFPEAHPFAPDFRFGFISEPARQFLFGRNYWKYRVIFVIDGREVTVIQILHGARRYYGESSDEEDAED